MRKTILFHEVPAEHLRGVLQSLTAEGCGTPACCLDPAGLFTVVGTMQGEPATPETPAEAPAPPATFS